MTHQFDTKRLQIRKIVKSHISGILRLLVVQNLTKNFNCFLVQIFVKWQDVIIVSDHMSHQIDVKSVHTKNIMKSCKIPNVAKTLKNIRQMTRRWQRFLAHVTTIWRKKLTNSSFFLNLKKLAKWHDVNSILTRMSLQFDVKNQNWLKWPKTSKSSICQKSVKWQDVNRILNLMSLQFDVKIKK